MHGVKRKASLEDPHARKQYENDLSIILNAALAKYSEEKSILKVSIVSSLGKGGQASVFLVELE